MVEVALQRYYNILLQQDRILQSHRIRQTRQNNETVIRPSYQGHLDVLEINLLTPCEHLPHDKMDESCEDVLYLLDFA